jgi:hypothetical protein
MHCIKWCVTLECSALLPTSAAQALHEAAVCGASLVLQLCSRTSYASQLALQRSLCLCGSHALLSGPVSAATEALERAGL